jgi:hypothetical protein
MKLNILNITSDSNSLSDTDDKYYIDTYGNKENKIIKMAKMIKMEKIRDDFNILKASIKKNNNASTKAISLWNYYKKVNKKNSKQMKQRDFYNKISALYGLPVKMRGVYYYKDISLDETGSNLQN